jgi:hypothetical protein
MATITISYSLTEAGRKADILAGGTGKSDRSIAVEITPELLAAANVDHEGRATYDLSKRRGCSSSEYSYASVMTAEQAAAEVLKVEAGLLAEDAKRKAEDQKRKAEESIRDLARWRNEAANLLAGKPNLHAWINSDGNVRIVTNPGTRIEYTLYAEQRGVPREEQAEFWTACQPILAKHKADQEAAEARKAAEDKRKEEAEAARIAEREAWILAHGSARLKEGLELGQIDRMAGAYRDERIAHDLGPKWLAWRKAPEPDDNDLLNPDEDALDALAEALKKWPHSGAELKSVGGTDKHGDEHDWRPALMMACPWDGRVVIRYLYGE